MNVAVGAYALPENTTGGENVAVGRNALRYNTTGNYNTAIGGAALQQSQTASENVAIGYQAMDSADGANNCIGIGVKSLDDCTTGVGNIGIGRYALADVTTNGGNTAIGAYDGSAQPALRVCTGHSNTAVGSGAGAVLVSGNKNTCIGYKADVENTGRDECVIIGHELGTHAADGTARIKADNGIYNTANSSTFNTTSDIRIKKDVVDCPQGLDVINQIRVRNFNYKTPEEIAKGSPELTHLDLKDMAVRRPELQIGVIAQEIEQLLPEVVTYDDNGVRDVNPERLTWILINAVKELSTKNDALAAEVEQLKSQLNN